MQFTQFTGSWINPKCGTAECKEKVTGGFAVLVYEGKPYDSQIHRGPYSSQTYLTCSGHLSELQQYLKSLGFCEGQNTLIDIGSDELQRYRNREMYPSRQRRR